MSKSTNSTVRRIDSQGRHTARGPLSSFCRRCRQRRQTGQVGPVRKAHVYLFDNAPIRRQNDRPLGITFPISNADGLKLGFVLESLHRHAD